VSVARQLAYVAGPKTGVPVLSAARQLGVSTRTLRGWLSGTTAPSKTSRGKLTSLYERFWRIDHKTRPAPSIATANLKISALPDGTITIQHRPRSDVLAERTRRDWSGVMAATTAEEAYEAFVQGIIVPSPLPPVEPDYLWFWEGSSYTVETV
jgi:hypothetical protein